MEQNMKHIDNLFQEELGNYTEAPPPMVWDALEKRLEGDRGKRAFPFGWKWYFTVISMVLVVSGSLAWNMSNTDSEAAAVTEVAAPVTFNENSASDNTLVTTNVKTLALNSNSKTETSVKHPKSKTHKAHITPKEEAVVIKRKKAQTHATAVVKPSETRTTAHEAASNKTAEANTNSEYDYYAAATGGDETAPAPHAKTEVDGYVVNVRRKNNIKVADMAPVEEKVAYHKPAEAQTSAEDMVVSTMPAARSEAHENKTQHTSPRKASHATAAGNNIATAHQQNKSAKAQASAKPMVVASTTGGNAAKTAVAKITAKAAAHNDKPVANNLKMAAVEKKAQPAQPAVATVAARAEAPVVHKVTSPAENTRTENKTSVKKGIVKQSAAIASKQPVAPTAKAPAEKPVAHKATATEAKVSSTATSEKKVPATQPTAKKDVATKQVAAIIPSTATSVSKVTERTATAAQPVVKKEVTTKQAAPNVLSATAGIGKAAKKTIASSVASKTAEKSKAADTKETALMKEAAEAPEPSKLPVAATSPIAKAPATKATRIEKPVVAKKEEEKTTAAIAEEKEAQKPTSNKAARQTTTAAKQSAPETTSNTFAAVASNTNAAKKVFKPSIFVEDPATIGMDQFFVAAVMKSNEEARLPGTFKEPQAAQSQQQLAPAITAQPVATVDSNTSKQAWRNKITGGIKVGVEGTYNNEGARRAIISPYLEYKMNDKMSFLLQPAFKLSNINKRALSGTQSYFKLNDDGNPTLDSTETIFVTAGSVILDTLYKRNYSYSQSHDSMSNSYSIGGNSFDFDIPLMLKYSLSKKLSVYGGVNLAFHKIGINKNTFNSGPVVIKADSFTMGQSATIEPTPPPVSSVIRYGTPTNEPQSPYSQPKGELNIGYMFGFSYEFRRRCLFDALIHQGFAKTNEVGGYNINTAFSLPYLRLTVGYRLMK